MMVVLHHLELQLNRVGYDGYWPHHFLDAGVDIFFVISGFIMWITTAKGMTTLEFYRRRVLRIVPLYWALTSVVLMTLVVYPSLVQSGRFDALHVVGSYLFLPVVHPVEGLIHPLLIPGWTLNYEMFFYAIFGVSLILPASRRLVLLLTVLCGLAAVPILTGTTGPVAMQFYTWNIIVEFAFGIALGWVYTSGIKLPEELGWPCLLVGAAVLVVVGTAAPIRGLSTGGPALLVVAGAVIVERLRGMPEIHSLRLLGNASYSLYLSHTIVLSAIGQLWRRSLHFDFPGEPLVFGGAAIATVLAGGVIVYFSIEVPMLRLGRLRILGKQR
jgi:exopolysaccharide production protein ExoZ